MVHSLGLPDRVVLLVQVVLVVKPGVQEVREVVVVQAQLVVLVLMVHFMDLLVVVDLVDQQEVLGLREVQEVVVVQEQVVLL